MWILRDQQVQRGQLASDCFFYMGGPKLIHLFTDKNNSAGKNFEELFSLMHLHFQSIKLKIMWSSEVLQIFYIMLNFNHLLSIYLRMKNQGHLADFMLKIN